MSKTGITLKLSGRDGNAMMICGKARQAIRRDRENEWTQEDKAALIEEFTVDAMSGDYDKVLRTCMKWFEVE